MFESIPQNKQYPDIRLCLVKAVVYPGLPVPVEGDLYIDGSIIESKLEPGVINDGWNKMHLAAWNGDIAGVQAALAEGINHIAGNNNGWLPIHLAAQQGHTVVVDTLLKAGGLDRVNCGNKLGWTPLHVAAWSGHVDIINMLLDYGLQPKQSSKVGWNPVHVAAWNGKQSSLEVLKSKVDLEVGNNDGWSVIHLAVWNNKLDLAKWLVDVGQVNPCNTNKDGWSALHIASWQGCENIVEFLLARNVQVDPKTSDYRITPLHLAVFKNYMKIVYSLVSNASDVPSLEYIEGEMKDTIQSMIEAHATKLITECECLLKTKSYAEAQNKIDIAIKLNPTAPAYYNKAIAMEALGSISGAIEALDTGLKKIINDEVLKHSMILYKSSIQYTRSVCEYEGLSALLPKIALQTAPTGSTDTVTELFEKSNAVLESSSNPEVLPHVLLFALHQYDLQPKDSTMDMVDKCLQRLATSVKAMSEAAPQNDLCKIYKASIEVMQEVKYGGKAIQETLLHIAVRESSAESVEFLVDMGWKDLNCLSQGDVSPLYLAMVCEQEHTVDALLKHQDRIKIYFEAEQFVGCHQPIVIALKQPALRHSFIKYAQALSHEGLKPIPLDILSEVESDLGRCLPSEMQQIYTDYEEFLKVMGYDTSGLCEYLPY